MSLRSITVLAALILLQLCACVTTTTTKPSGPSVNELERRHDEMMQRMGGGSGSGM